MRRSVRLTACSLALSLACAFNAGAADLHIFTLASGQGTYADSPTSWLDGGFGKLPGSSDADGSAAASGALDVQAGLRLDLGTHWSVWTHVIARAEDGVDASGSAGVTELWIEGSGDVAGGRLRARAGMLFLPTSRENVDVLWSSPYTISLSAINSWMAEEVRPTGVDLDYRYELAPGVQLRAGGTAIVGNDTAGTLLAWRGWSIGSRVSVRNEELPLPPLSTFSTSFPAQKNGTTPFGRDLDDRAGWSARIRVDAPRNFVAQWTRFDTRGDRLLYDGQYSWRTSFDLVGLGWQPVERLTLAAEHIRGKTGMGIAPADRVDAQFEATYTLASWRIRQFRFSTRYDWFETEERDFSAAESNDETGSALAVAIIFEATPAWSLAVELDDLEATRPSATGTLGTASLDGRVLLLWARYSGIFD
ncbi:MAG: hypothetical protein WC538_11890 [Thermoanaerobaculia bacterium]